MTDDVLHRSRETFGPNAEAYRTSESHGAAEELARMVRLVRPEAGERALDVASGGGHTGVALALAGARVTALDATPPMLAQTHQLAVQRGVAVERVEADAHALPFPDAAFTVVACRIAPHHFRDLPRAVAEWARVLAPGGRLYLLDTSSWDGDAAEAFINALEVARDPSHVHAHGRASWRRLLGDAGFAVEHDDLRAHTYVLETWLARLKAPPERRAEVHALLAGATDALRVRYRVDLAAGTLETAHYEALARRRGGGSALGSAPLQ